MLPAVIASRPAMRRKRVLFPQPEGPTKTINSLSWMVRLMRRRMVFPAVWGSCGGLPVFVADLL